MNGFAVQYFMDISSTLFCAIEQLGGRGVAEVDNADWWVVCELHEQVEEIAWNLVAASLARTCFNQTSLNTSVEMRSKRQAQLRVVDGHPLAKTRQPARKYMRNKMGDSC